MKKVIRAVFDDPNGVSPESVAESQELKKLIKLHMVDTIASAFDSNKTFAPLFEINDSAFYVELHKKNWVSALETCLLWYVEEENYEVCTKIKDLIHRIKRKGKKNIDLNDDASDGF